MKLATVNAASRGAGGKRSIIGCARLFAFCNHPHSMNNAGNVTENRQNDIEPEMLAESDLEKNTKGRQENSENDFQQFHHFLVLFKAVNAVCS